MACPTYRAFANEKLCSQDMLNDLFFIRRDIDLSNEDAIAVTTTNLFDIWAACETLNKLSHSAKIAGLPKVTHKFYVRYDEWMDYFGAVRVNLEKHYFTLDGKNYRIRNVEQVNQRKNVICLYCHLVSSGFDLDIEYALTNLTGVRSVVIGFDPVTESETVNTVNYTGKGIFTQYATNEIDNEQILRTDVKLLLSIYEVTAVPKINDHISDGVKNYQVINVDLDHLLLQWNIQLRLT